MSRQVTTQKPQTSLTTVSTAILQRACACGSHTPAGGECASCSKKKEEGTLQRFAKSDSSPQEVPQIVHEVLHSPGQPLDSATRAFMESGLSHEFSNVRLSSVAPARARNHLAVGEPNDIYEQEAEQVADSLMRKKGSQNNDAENPRQQKSGFDLSQVRIHTDGRAAESARAVNALAYTVGPNIVFAAGQYQPAREYGQRLLAHELTHVAQQRATDFSSVSLIQRQPAAAAAPAPAMQAGGLSEEMLKQIVRALHEAMAGAGTDEEAIYSAFAGRTQEQVDAIAAMYQTMYKVDLLKDLKGELNASEMKHLAIYSPTAVPGVPGSAEQNATLADMVAAQLHKAMKGLGTDEESIYAALTGRTQNELKAIKDAYARLTKHDLAADIEDEMSGTELTRAMALLQQGMLLPEDEIYLSVKGLGTDEDTLFRVLESLKGDRARIKNTIDQYAAKGYGDMLDDIRDDLSNIFGNDLSRAMELLHGETPSGSCSTEERKKGLEAISVAVSMTQNAVSRADADLSGGQLSGTIQSALQNNFNPGNAANAVNINLLRQVRDILDRARTEILMRSDVTCVAQDPRFCVAKPDCTNFTYGWTGVGVVGDTVTLCNAFFSCLTDENARGRGLVHEFIHHMGVNDKFYRHVAGFSTLTPQGNQSNTDSLDNADSFAHFAKDLL